MIIDNINSIESMKLLNERENLDWEIRSTNKELYFDFRFPFIHVRTVPKPEIDIVDSGWWGHTKRISLKRLNELGCFIKDNKVYYKPCIVIYYISGKKERKYFDDYTVARRELCEFEYKHPEFITRTF